MCWLVDQRIGLNIIMVRCAKPQDIQDYLVRLVKTFNLMLRQIELSSMLTI